MKPLQIALLVVVVALSAGCRQANPYSPSDAPLIVDFSADAYTITAGSVVMLHWTVEQSDGVRIDSGGVSLGDVPAKGAAAVSPTVTTWYRLTATNRAGLVQRTLNITVLPK